jgi:cell fate (sporulation/competence/biofilm development) regulator YlbF (YheA/YmcA/DUF963 family)
MFKGKDDMMRGREQSLPPVVFWKERGGADRLRKTGKTDLPLRGNGIPEGEGHPPEKAEGGTRMEYSAAYRLADEIKQSEEYRTYHGLKKEVMGDETLAALIREYRKMQVTLQMNVMAGQQNDPEEMQRFTALSGLLFAKPEVSQFLLAEMRLQQTMADILKIVTEATGLDIQLPG